MSRIKYKIAEELAKIAEELITAGRPSMTTEEFIERAREVHGDAFDYSKVDMDNRDDKGRVLIRCKKCGSEFWQRPDKHLDGNGCMNCYVRETGITPGEPSEDEGLPSEDEGLQMDFNAPAQSGDAPRAQSPAHPAEVPTAPKKQPAPVAEPSKFQQQQPLRQPVVK